MYNFLLRPLFAVLASNLDEVKIRLFEKIRTKLSRSTCLLLTCQYSLNIMFFIYLVILYIIELFVTKNAKGGTNNRC